MSVEEYTIPYEKNYDLLHAEMSAIGFDRYVYHQLKKKTLPTGLYRRVSDDSLGVVLASVVGAAAKTQHKSSIVVFPVSDIATFGLQEEFIPFSRFAPPSSSTGTLAPVSLYSSANAGRTSGNGWETDLLGIKRK
jgi:hypothetical protein